MSRLLPETVAVITGASSGIGRATARLFAENGADVVIADIREEPRTGGAPTHELIEDETDSQGIFVECDVTNVDDVERAVSTADELGQLDVMVNAAAMHRPHDFLTLTEDEYDQMMDLNLKAVCFGCQRAAARMVEQGSGSIINFSSTAGIHGSKQSATYSASKGGVRLLTYSLANILGPDGVRVNVIHPGLTETMLMTEDVPVFETESLEKYLDAIPLGRAAEPREIAKGVLFLASDLGSYVNGESLIIDGGATH